MFQELVSRNPDLQKLLSRGYAIGFDSGHLVVRDVPYLDGDRKLQIGAIVSKLNFIDRYEVKQVDHQIFFCGSHPHGLDGKPIQNLGGGPAAPLLEKKDLVVERSFSNKPANGFSDLSDKIESYVAIISGPAEALYGASPLTFRVDPEVTLGSVFKFHDTLTSRAELGDLSARFRDDVVAIIGLGGTGAYVFDLLAKTPVKEVRGFDLDGFHVHNAFRSPGRLEETELGRTKAQVYQARYENFREGLSATAAYIDAASAADLEGVTFAFVCVDKGTSRSGIFDVLMAKSIPFIDVGMGLDRVRDALDGMMRVTYYPQDAAAEIRAKHLAEMADVPDDIYKSNIQIAELNAMNACLAVIRYKQLRGFYADDAKYYHMIFGIGDLRVVGEPLG